MAKEKSNLKNTKLKNTKLKNTKLKYKRVLLKLSGEVLAGGKDFGHDAKVFKFILSQINQARDLGAEIALVIGGGNIVRGKQAKELEIEEIDAHYMGMLATAINAIAFESYLNKNGVEAKAFSMLYLDNLIEKFSKQKAIDSLSNGKVVLFACGTGSPYFTTDTGASLKAIEIKADLLIKATSVKGVYDKDPKKYDDAKFIEKISYNDILTKNLKFIDSTAVSMCRDNNMPLVVYNMKEDGGLVKILKGEKIGSLVEP
ncbi:MAG: UMP kinase [Bdellovibrionota bacterium]